ncbi:hypothetical protein NFH98_20855 [Halomonas sp. H33-56]|uniref:hypothetical protein n=1 Tax=Halomonas sp. H33-56 TaxID=2950873 RepID=UPI0032DEF985
MKMSSRVMAFLIEVENEHGAAVDKFPSPEASMCALTEEVGELAKALLEESPERVRREAIQVATMAMRVALEGDPTLNGYRHRIGVGTHPEGEHVGDRVVATANANQEH